MQVDLSRFRDTFFEEAAEHVATIEQSLLAGSTDRIRTQWVDNEWETRGLTGLIVRAESDDELVLVADLAGTRDEPT